ncbi:MAG TPA: hypothetical protein VFA66_07945 [Gaiellaceae bacterium]|nr:hypothetical protein [Gaiellaceae bacterium]
MADVRTFSEQVIDYAERLADMADAAKGKTRGRRMLPRWLVLPAAGAGLYALIRSDSFTRGAKGMMHEAKGRASELPEDLIGRVRQAPQSTSGATRPEQKRHEALDAPKAFRADQVGRLTHRGPGPPVCGPIEQMTWPAPVRVCVASPGLAVRNGVTAKQ